MSMNFSPPLIPLIRITEQPYKIPFYAALLYYLSIPTLNDDTGTSEESIVKPPLGRLILDDFWKGFQAYLDKLAWRETRLCVRPDTPFSFMSFPDILPTHRFTSSRI